MLCNLAMHVGVMVAHSARNSGSTLRRERGPSVCLISNYAIDAVCVLSLMLGK